MIIPDLDLQYLKTSTYKFKLTDLLVVEIKIFLKIFLYAFLYTNQPQIVAPLYSRDYNLNLQYKRVLPRKFPLFRLQCF